MSSCNFLRGRFGLVGFVATSLIVLVVVAEVQAKRGCFAYGHSCLGGLGKRAEANEIDMGTPTIEGRALVDSGNGMDDVMRAARFEGHDEAWPWLDGRLDNGEQFAPLAGRQMQGQMLTPQQLYQMSPFIRQLIRSLRTNQDPNIPDV